MRDVPSPLSGTSHVVPGIARPYFAPTTASVHPCPYALMHRVLLILLACILGAVTHLPAQTPAPCTYDACALRLDPGWGGMRIVRGEEGAPVAGVGLFGTRALSDLVQGSDRALEHARVYERTAPVAAWMGLAGAVLLVVPLYAQDRGDAGALLGMSVAGLGLSLYGTHLQIRSHRALSRAIWWYNRELPR